MTNSRHEFIAVDFQKDFTRPEGVCFNQGSSISFVKTDLLSFFRKNDIKTHEVISDYRLPRSGSKTESCVPGTFGFDSDLEEDVKHRDPWIKCMHNPLWIRNNIGKTGKKYGIPYQNPRRFNQWLTKHFGFPNDDLKIVLFGLTMEVCLLSLAQELYFRGYKVEAIYEATDPMNERISYKESIARHSTLSIYADVISFETLKSRMYGCEIDG